MEIIAPWTLAYSADSWAEVVKTYVGVNDQTYVLSAFCLIFFTGFVHGGMYKHVKNNHGDRNY